MFYDVILEGLKKFAGEIIGVILLIAAWRIFPGLRKLFGKYNSLKDSESKPVQDEGEVERLKNELQRQKEALAQAEAQKAEEAKRREEMQRELEAKHFAAMGDDEFIELCKSGDVAQVKKALKYGANVNAKGKGGWTPFMWVAWKGYTELAELFIKYGAEVDARDDSGRTALINAVISDRIKSVELLLKYGANANAGDNMNWTALRFVTNNTRMKNLLRSYGAK